MSRKRIAFILLAAVLCAGIHAEIKTDAGLQMPVPGKWREYGQTAADLVITPKDAKRPSNLRNTRGSVTLFMSYQFSGVPWGGVPRDVHC
ncbi:hypothetical protein ACFL4W_04690 [Planctomycetota bacterium]